MRRDRTRRNGTATFPTASSSMRSGEIAERCLAYLPSSLQEAASAALLQLQQELGQVFQSATARRKDRRLEASAVAVAVRPQARPPRQGPYPLCEGVRQLS